MLKLIELKDTFAGKCLAVFMSFVLVFVFCGIGAYANDQLTQQAESEQTEVTEPDESGTATNAKESADSSASSSSSSSSSESSSASSSSSGSSANSGSSQASSESSQPAAVAETETEVDVTFDVSGYAVVKTADGQTVGKTVTTTKAKAFTFTAAPASADYEISAVTINNDPLEPKSDGSYEVPATKVVEGLVVKVETEAVQSDDEAANDESADDEAAADEAANEDEAADTQAADEQSGEQADQTENQATEYPAYEGYAQAGGTLVKVTAAEGALPAGTTVQATLVNNSAVEAAVESAVSDEGATLQSLVVIDVTLLDAQGNEVQPNGAVNVCFFDAGLEGESVAVYYVSDDASTVETVATRQADSDVQSFDVSHFSTYAVAGANMQQPGQGGNNNGGEGQFGANTEYVKIAIGDTAILPTSGTVSGSNHSWSIEQQDWNNTNYIKLTTNENGTATVTGLAEGEVLVKHTYYGQGGNGSSMGQPKTEKTEFFSVTVKPSTSIEPSLSVSPETASIARWETTTLTANAQHVSGTVVWSSSEDSIATVDSSGVVTGKAPGTVTITATAGGLSDTATITVTENTNEAKTAYFYVQKPNGTLSDTSNASWLYVGTGTINDTGLGLSVNNYSFDVDNRVISFPDDSTIKQAIAKAYGIEDENLDEVTITYTPHKISYTWGAPDAANENLVNGNCYHVDMAVSITTNQYVTANWYLWDAGSTGYNVVHQIEKVQIGENGTASIKAWSDDYNAEKVEKGVKYKLVTGSDGHWFTNMNCTEQASFPYSTSEAANFYAKYVPVDTYSLAYDANAGDDVVSNLPTDTQRYWQGATVTVKSAPERAGYTFTGWNTAADGTGTSYKAGTTFAMGEADVTLYAQWEVNAYTVTYFWSGIDGLGDSLDGTGQDGNDLTITIPTDANEYAKGSTYKVDNTYTSNSTFVYGGNVYTFSGWMDADDNTVSGEQTMGEANVELTGEWKKTATRVYVFVYLDPHIGIPSEGGKSWYPMQVQSGSRWFAAGWVDVAYSTEMTTEGVTSCLSDETFNYWKGQPEDFSVTSSDVITWSGENTFSDGTSVTAGLTTDGSAHSNPMTTESGVYCLNGYVKATELTYTVEYYKDGLLQTADTLKPTSTYNWPNLASKTVAIQEGAVPEAPEKKYDDYYLSKVEQVVDGTTTNIATSALPSVGDQVANGTVYKIYYSSDQSASHSVKYSWRGIADDMSTLTGTDSSGKASSITLPTNDAKYAAGDKYPVDSTYKKGDVFVYGGNVYTFSGWILNKAVVTDDQIMGEADITLEGVWEKTATRVYTFVYLDDRITPVPNYYNSNWTKMQIGSSRWFAAGWVDVDDSQTLTKGGTVSLSERSFHYYKDIGTNFHITSSVITWSGTATCGNTTVTAGLTTDGSAHSNPMTTESGVWCLNGYVQAAELSYTVEYYKGDQKVEEDSFKKVAGYTWPNQAEQVIIQSGAVPTAPADKYTGYELDKVTVNDVEETNYSAPSVGSKVDNRTVYRIYYKAADTAYKVEHYQVGYGGTATLVETESFTGKTDATVTASARSYGGYTYDPSYTGTVASGTVASDGSLVLKLYYTQDVTATAEGYSGIYDGKSHGINVSGYPEGAKVTYYSDADLTQSIDNSFVDATLDAAGNVAKQTVYYKVKLDGHAAATGSATVAITPATLTVTTPSDSKVYDGAALTKEGAISGFVTVDGVAETATFTTTGTQTAVGDSKNTYTLTWNGTAKQSNYTVSESIGTLTVTENADEIVVTTTGGTFTYDGKAHGATVSVSDLPTGYTLEKAESNDTATHVADGTVTANCDTLVIKNAAGEDVTSKLNIKYVNGSIAITPATLTVTTPTDSKVYDGTALTAEGTISGFVNNETATFVTTGTQTAVGSSDNTYTLTWNGTATQSDYTVSESVGKLTVTENANEIVVTTTGGTFAYDGQAHGATVSVSTLPTGYTLEKAESNDTATHVAEGTVTANCDELVIKNAAGEDVTSKLKITYVNGSIAITPATLTVSTPAASRAYNGKALTAEGTISGLVNGETATFATTGTQTNAGESNNTYTLTWDGTATQSDYTVSESVGKLIVSKAEVTLKSADLNKAYDGTALTNGDTALTTETGWAEGEGAAYAFTGSQTLAGYSANAFTCTLNSNTKADNYTINKSEGTLTVTDATAKLEVTLEANSTTATYDGKEHSATGVKTDTFTVNGKQFKVSGYTTSGTAQTNAGTYNNVVSASAGGYVVTDENNNDVTSQFTVKTTDGRLTISNRSVTLTSATDSKQYDGTPLTNSTVTVGGDGFVSGEVSNITATGSITNVGEATNTITYTTGTNFNESNYDITKNGGTLKVTANTDKVTVTIIGKTASGTYSGKERTVSGYTVTDDSGLYNSEAGSPDFTFSGTAEAKGTNANTYNMGLAANQFENINANFTNVEFVVTDGTLTISPKKVTITVSNSGKMYGANDPEFSGAVDGLVNDGDLGTITYKRTNPDENVGMYEGVLEAEYTANDNYIVSVEKGDFTITESDANGVSVTGSTATYNGQAYALQSVSATQKGSTLEYSTDYSAANASAATWSTTEPTRTDAGTTTVWVRATNPNYATTEPVSADIVVNQREVTFTGESGTVAYNGSEHSLTGIEVSGTTDAYGTGLVSRHASNVTASAAGTVAGEYQGAITAAGDVRITANGVDVTANYKITTTPGKLTITGVATPITLTANSDSKVYDGTALTNDGFTVSSGSLLEGDTVTATVVGSQTAAGEGANTITAGSIRVMRGTLDVTDSYTFTDTVAGVLAVAQRPVTLLSSSDSWTYDGDAHNVQEVEDVSTGSGAGIVPGESFVYSNFATITDVGSAANTYDVAAGNGTNLSNYTITENEGILTVSAASMQVGTLDDVVYNGTAQAQKPTVTDANGAVLAEGADYTVSFSADTTNVGTVTVTVTGTGNYTGSVERTYQITRAAATITVDDAAKTYGSADPAFTGSVSGLYGNDTLGAITYSRTNTAEDAGTYDGVLTATYDGNANYTVTVQLGTFTIAQAGSNYVTLKGSAATYDGQTHGINSANAAMDGSTIYYSTDNSTWSTDAPTFTDAGTYTVYAYASNLNYEDTAVTSATVTISPRVVTLTGSSASKTYDGTALTGGTVEATGFVEGEGASYDFTGTQTNAGTTTNTFDYTLNEGTNAGNYTITKTEGTLRVDRASLTVTTGSANKTYDGTALTAEGEVSGLVNGETLTFATTGSQTAVGSSTNAYSITWNGTASEANYTVSEQLGTLTVSQYAGEIVVTATGGTFTYDGTAHGATVSVSTLPTGYSVEAATSSAAVTDATTEPVTATCDTLVIRNAAGEDVTSSLNVRYVPGAITVVPATLTVTTPSDSKVYDGTALTAADGATVSGLAAGESVELSVTGSQTAVGTSDNTYSIGWTGANASNYTIVENLGKLTVTENADEIVVTTTGGTFTYDGTAHGATVSVSTLPDGYTLETATSSATATDATTEPVAATCDTLVIRNAEGQDVTDSLNVRYVPGTITVVPATLAVTTASASKAYDTTALTAEGEVSGLVNGETLTFATTGSQTDAGTSANAYSIDWNGTAKQSNYTIVETLGTLEVTPAIVTIAVDDAAKTYGSADPAFTGSVSGLYGSDTLGAITYSRTNTAEDAGTYDGVLTATCEGNANYTVVVEPGSFTVNPAPLFVMTASATKAYDGTPLTAEGYILGLLGSDTVDLTATGSQTEVGSSTNTYSISWTGALASNYSITEVLGTLTVTEAAAVPGTTTTTDTTGTPGTTPTGTPAVVETVIDALATPFAAPDESDETTIADEENPLATIDLDCWVHWYILLGLVVTVVYGGGVMIRRRKFSADLGNYEDSVLGK